MKRLKAGDPKRQEAWEASGAIFSIVNLRIPPHFEEIKTCITPEEKTQHRAGKS